MKADPRALLSPLRLDIAVKHRFFRHLIAGADPASEAAYRWHIEKRTGGFEKRSWKRSVDDYVTGCRSLLASMQARGFDPGSPIPLGANGLPRDGAHRLACALALGLPAWVRDVPQPGPAWGRAWFLAAGMPADEVAELESAWERLAST